MKRTALNIATIICLIATFTLVSCSGKGSKKVEGKKTAAEGAATSWLAMIDGEDYEGSWDESAEYFKGAIAKDDWIKMLDAVRKPLGKMESRKVKSSKYTTTLPGAPDGEYVVFEFETSFENKKNSVETITPMLDKDGQWRVGGYYIK